MVPEDLYRTTFTKYLKDWTQIFYQFGLGAAALKVIRDRGGARRTPEASGRYY